MTTEDFAKALGADVVIPLDEPGAKHITDVMTFGAWFNIRQALLLQEDERFED